MTSLPFVKLHAAGNAYLAIDARDGAPGDLAGLARAMGRPHTGVGSDGLLVALPARAPGAAIRLRVFNTDGSEAEMSGNGVRLFAKFVLDRQLARCGDDGALCIETRAGLRRVWPHLAAGSMTGGRVDMDVPSFRAADLPMQSEHEEWIARPLELADGPIELTCLSLGNPHAVHLITSDVAAFPLAEVGEAVQHHRRFPRGVNFEVAQVLATDRLGARIYERGEGETPSSGTGSTACAVAARKLGRVGPEVRVELPGGVLEIAWPGEGEAAWLDGPTVEVFRGEWRL